MGKARLITGVAVGATVGAIVALLDKDTREYAKTQLNSAKSCSSHYIKNPSEAVQTFRTTVDRWNETLTSGADNAINALEQVEETINKFTNNN